jgi:hypothetical protein
MVTNDARCTREIKTSTAMAKAAFNKKKAFFTRKLELYLRKKITNCEIWSIATYRAETWKLRKVNHKYLDSFEVLCWRKMEKISWTDRVRNEEILLKIHGGEKYPKNNKRKEALVTSFVGTAFKNTLLKER